MAPTKKPAKAPTEQVTLDDIWDNFEPDYLPFVEWTLFEGNKIATVEFTEDAPTEYANKWSRTQWKMRVIQDGDDKILSGGKRLWYSLKLLCQKHNKRPSDMGLVVITRKGSGFDTSYEFSLN